LRLEDRIGVTKMKAINYLRYNEDEDCIEDVTKAINDVEEPVWHPSFVISKNDGEIFNLYANIFDSANDDAHTHYERIVTNVITEENFRIVKGIVGFQLETLTMDPENRMTYEEVIGQMRWPDYKMKGD
jgi:hypothetical protein